MKNAFSKVLRMGRTTALCAGLVVTAGLWAGLGSSAVAGTGVNGVFNFGQTSTVNALSVLTGSVSRAMLVL